MKKKIIPVLIAVLLIIILSGIYVAKIVLDKYSYSKEEMDLNYYFHVNSPENVPIVLEDEIIEATGVLSNDSVYLPLSFVKEYLNDRFYFSQTDQLLLYTTPTDLIAVSPDSASYTVSDNPVSFDKAVYTMKEEPYLNMDFAMQYANFYAAVYDSPKRVQIYLKDKSYMTATVNKDNAVRFQGGIKSDVLENLKSGDSVYVLEQMENWSKVKTMDSVIGYLENKRLDMKEDTVISIPANYAEPEYTNLCKDYPINMAWHQVTNMTANDTVDSMLAQTKAVNTISPTWFFLNDDNGNFTSIASQDYVNKMHARNIEVWALIDNFTNDVNIGKILSTLDNRKRLISGLLNQAKTFSLDGINIDFEQVPMEAGEDYIEFIRELSIACRQNNLVLSVDNYVPTGYTAHYNRKEQGVVADYVVIMGYDEHYSGSPEAGSVASIGYVKQGIEDTVSKVPSYKVINAIPFYTRLWKLSGDVSSEAMSMSAAEMLLADKAIPFSWDEETCQNYAAWDEEGTTYQIWLEDADSLAAKLSVMGQYGLGGIAQWKLGLEQPKVWDLIEKYVSGGYNQANGEAAVAPEEVPAPEEAPQAEEPAPEEEPAPQAEDAVIDEIPIIE